MSINVLPIQLYRFLSLFLFLALCLNASAQLGGGQRQSTAADRVEAMKVAYITQELNLTPAEAQLFWPLYNQNQAELKQLRASRRADLVYARLNFNQISDAEMEKIIDRVTDIIVKEAEAAKRHVTTYKRVLPIRKVALLYRAELSFRRVLLQRLRENAPSSTPLPPVLDGLED
jgi:hypothetical protein